jgi:DinB family protein
MLQQISLIYKLNNGVVTRTLDGLSDDEVWQSPPGGGNPIGWILGHLAEYRTSLLALLGSPLQTEWQPRLFGRGAVRGDRRVYPPRASIVSTWNATHAAMRDAFAAATAAQLSGPPAIELPGVRTLADQIAFGAFHESYHVGQMGYVRRQLGHSAVVG